MQLQKTLVKIQPQLTENGLSVYSGELTLKAVIEQNMRIKQAFPNLPNEWYEIFQNRIIENHFTDNRLVDAVNYVIDHCQYPTPTIAQFIQYDVKIPVKTYQELLLMLNDDKKVFDHYKAVKIENVDKPMYAREEDIQKYKLKLFTREDKMNLQEKLEKQRKSKKLQDEIERLETLKYRIKQKDVFKRTFEETKFLEGVDETIEKLENELFNL